MNKIKTLILVESPNKIKTISKILKDAGWKDFLVKASVGHISEIKDGGSYYNSGIEPTEDFKTNYVVSNSKKEVVKELVELVKNVDQVYVCSDPDREGEAIAWSLKKFLKIPKEKCKRATFHEITPKAVLKALENPGNIDEELVDAAQSRQQLDKMLGYRLSPIARRYIYAPSVGRCQSAGLKILVDREKEIQNFVPMTYYDLILYFSKNNNKYKAKYVSPTKEDKITDKELINKVKIDTQGHDFKIIDKTFKERISNPKLPFTTSTFQQEVSNKLGIGVKEAMSYAQKLFEGIDIKGQHVALTTYIRTDSTDIAEEFIPVLTNFIKTTYGEKYYAPIRKVAKSENQQDGHECLRVVDLDMTPERLSNYISNNSLLKVYSIIYKRTVAAMMAPSITNETIYTIENNKHNFEFSSKELAFDGYKKVYDFKEKDEEDLVKDIFEIGEILKETSLEDIEKATQPPARFKEATFIKELESTGIGRPSTFATIVETLLDEKRGYCTQEDKCMKPTEKGIKLSEFLDESFPNLISLTYTSELESDLDKIATGKLNRLDFMNSFYNSLETSVKQMKKPIKERVERVEAEEKCPECGSKMYLRKGPFGEFYGCSRYPKCKGILKKE